MMIGSPGVGGGHRRRRLLSKLGVGPKNPEHYTAVLSSSSRDIRKTRRSAERNSVPGFRPIESHDNGYRIDVSNDRSMIQVVPIEGDHSPGSTGGSQFKSPQRNRLPPRVSPVVYSEPRSSPSIASAAGLLDARDSQRRKMKSRKMKSRLSPPRTKTSRPPKNAQSAGQSRSPVSNARNKLKKALQLSTGDGEQRQRSRKISDRPANSNRVRWDMSNGGHPSQTASKDSSTSFPILSSHRFESFSEEKKEINSYEDLLRQRVHDIQDQQKKIRHAIAEKDTIKGTLVTAIDGNLERNRKHMSALDEELKEIEWHLSLDAKKKQSRKSLRFPPQPMNGKPQNESADVEVRQRRQSQTPVQQSNRVPLLKNETEVQQQFRVPSPAYDMESVSSVGDPSITADTDSVAAVFRSKHKGEERVLVTGLDPPSVGSAVRRSPVTVPRYFEHRATNKAKEPAAPRISAVVRGEEAMRYGTVVLNQLNDELRLDSVEESPNRGHEMQQDRASSSSERISLRPPPRHPWRRRSRNASPQTNLTRQAQDRSVTFSDSEELVFESQSSVDTRRNNNDNEIMNALMPPLGESSSWQEENFGVDKFNDVTGSDIYPYSNREQQLAVTDRYSHEAHHHQQRLQSRMPTLSSEANRKEAVVRNRGVSSDSSVETDEDLSFIRSVAAVVIQTATRRYLAELEADDRRYAVQVIQSAIWNWMYPIGRGYLDAEYDQFSGDLHDEYGTYYDEDERFFVNRDFYDATGGGHAPQAPQQHYRSIYRAPNDDTSQRSSKRVTFVDDYDLDEFAATEIQRVFRGWWARDTIELNHYAATTIQRVFRGFWLRDSLEVDRYCATEIQRAVRGWLQRRSYIYDLYCIIVAQSVSRRYLAFYESAVRLANIFYIQAIYRGYRVRSDLRLYGVDFCIHRHCGKLYQNASQPSAGWQAPHHSNTRTQNVPTPIAKRPVPKRIVHSEEEVLASAILIQAIFRGYRVRDELYRFVRNGQDIAATIIQTCWRRYDAEMNFINHLADVLIVQSIARRWLVRKKLERKGIVLGPTSYKSPSQNSSNRFGYTTRFNQKKTPSTHDEWKQHRLKVLERSTSVNSRTTRSSFEGFENFDKDSVAGDDWYCENKSQASDLLQSWRSR